MVRHEWMRDALLAYIRRCGWEHAVAQQQVAVQPAPVAPAEPALGAPEQPRVAVQS